MDTEIWISYNTYVIWCIFLLMFFFLLLKNVKPGSSLAAQWLRLHIFTAEGMGSIPDQRAKIPQGQKKKKIAKKTQTPKTHNSNTLSIKDIGVKPVLARWLCKYMR